MKLYTAELLKVPLRKSKTRKSYFVSMDFSFQVLFTRHTDTNQVASLTGTAAGWHNDKDRRSSASGFQQRLSECLLANVTNLRSQSS